jgi:hypothetical protein
MKEDYLWDKTGQDPEIEQLEIALQTFRYQETVPPDLPALPAKVLRLAEKTPRRTFRLAFAFAACAAIFVVALGVWFQISTNKIEITKDSAETSAPQLDTKISDVNPPEKQEDFIVESVKTPKPFVKQYIIKPRTAVQAKVRQNNLTARNAPIKKPAVKLTTEEKYAYDQLMLALAITGSKLKLVTDKIEKTEEPNITSKNER